MQNFPWGHSRRYNDFQTAFSTIFPGEKIQKISVNAGFTCPNRDGSRGTGGCVYCNNASFSPYFSESRHTITEQLDKGIRFFARKYPEMKYLAFFQSFSNTYAPPGRLKQLYGEALEYPGVKGLVISTRPDCVSDEILDYLADLSYHHYVMLEFGVESHLDATLSSLNRGHTFAESVDAIEKASERGIHTTAHVIMGLPGESRADWLGQAAAVSGLKVENLKMHQLQIHKGTLLARQFAENPEAFILFSDHEYAELVVDYLELLDPKITVERFTSQAPPGMLIAPAWGIKNYVFTAKVEKLLAVRDTWQGKYYRKGINPADEFNHIL